MGVAMMTGIMAIFEMGLSLTGQSLLSAPLGPTTNTNLHNSSKAKNQNIVQTLSTVNFHNSVLANDLCDALQQVDGEPWSFIEKLEDDDYFFGACELTREGIYRNLVRENNSNQDMPYQLFTCVLEAGESKCSFEGR